MDKDGWKMDVDGSNGRWIWMDGRLRMNGWKMDIDGWKIYGWMENGLMDGRCI